MRMSALIVAATLLTTAGAQEKPSKEEIEASVKKVKELRKERTAALKDAVDIFTLLLQAMHNDYVEASEARLLLLQAELDAAEKGADRIALYKRAIDSLKQYEGWAKATAASGQATNAAVLKIKARRLEVEIQLERADHPQERATPVMKDQADEPAKAVRELRKERIAVLKKLVDLTFTLFKDARGPYDDVLEAKRLLSEAELEGAGTDAERGEILKNLIAVERQSEEIAQMRVRVGRVTPAVALMAKARRLEAEIRLEQVKMRVKVAEPEPAQPRRPEVIPPPRPAAKPGMAQPRPELAPPPRPRR